jgi:hypothetical protein
MNLTVIGNKKCPCEHEYPFHGLMASVSEGSTIHIVAKERANTLTYYRVRRLEI